MLATMASSPLGGVVDADPAVVGLVIVAVLVVAVIYLGRIFWHPGKRTRGRP
jgi:hypothetical protein